MSQHPKIEITRTKRKSISMRFDNDGVLQVRAPRFILEYQIQSFLKKNTPWIDREYKKILERQQ